MGINRNKNIGNKWVNKRRKEMDQTLQPAEIPNENLRGNGISRENTCKNRSFHSK